MMKVTVEHQPDEVGIYLVSNYLKLKFLLSCFLTMTYDNDRFYSM